MPDRVYSESEVAAILARAAQRTAPEMPGAPGLTLAEIERAGREAGLDPDAIRTAASDFDAGGAAAATGRTTVAERWLDREPPPGAWEDAVADLRWRLGPTAATGGTSTPDVRSIGEGEEWVHQSMGGIQTTVSVSPRDGRTRVRVVRTEAWISDPGVAGVLAGGLGALLPAVLAGALVAETAGLGDAWGVAAMLTTYIVLALGIGLTVTHRRRARRRSPVAETDRLADHVADALSGSPTPATAIPDDVADASRLDLSALGPEPDAPVPTGRRTRA